MNVSSTLGSFYSTDSTCAQSTNLITIPSGLGLALIYYKHSSIGSATLTLSDPLSSLTSVSKLIQIDSPGPSGTLDTTFDADGKLTTAIGSSTDEAAALALQPDGKIVVDGSSDDDSVLVFSLIRLWS